MCALGGGRRYGDQMVVGKCIAGAWKEEGKLEKAHQC